jgi:hypothetical protein
VGRLYAAEPCGRKFGRSSRTNLLRSLSPREERAGTTLREARIVRWATDLWRAWEAIESERGFLDVRVKHLLSPALSSFLRQEARESAFRHFGHACSQSSTPGTVKLWESSSRPGGFPFGFTTDGHGFTQRGFAALGLLVPIRG